MKYQTLATALAACALAAGCATQAPGAAGASAAACKPAQEAEIAALFEQWNAALQTGDPQRVVVRYAPQSLLLPTVSNQPRFTPEEKQDYFRHFMENRPSGSVDLRRIEVGCNTAVDAGLYTFRFAKTGATVRARYTYTYRWDGANWLITSHHSSAMPEKQ